MQALALFDLDNTLVQRDLAFGAWAAEFAAEHGVDAGWLVAADARHEGPRGGFFDLVRDRFGLDASGEELWRQYRRRMPELVRCRGEDLAALAGLRAAGWRVGIVTNGTTGNQLGKIRNTGLDRHVDAWCISEDVDLRKPDPRIFRLAAARCGLSADGGGWMVGDSLAHDIAGGAAAGLRTAWITQPGATPDPRPDVTAGSVAEAVVALLATA
ncbi:HAD family hydrolase [Dactylosporangium sp. NPDC051485]|uniref:HAD family hydrolase n=1 Tax=Dactylosporangium sp. NPDC051485 TaxID=3154846 RepID=UPI00343BAAE8